MQPWRIFHRLPILTRTCFGTNSVYHLCTVMISNNIYCLLCHQNSFLHSSQYQYILWWGLASDSYCCKVVFASEMKSFFNFIKTNWTCSTHSETTASFFANTITSRDIIFHEFYKSFIYYLNTGEQKSPYSYWEVNRTSMQYNTSQYNATNVPIKSLLSFRPSKCHKWKDLVSLNSFFSFHFYLPNI